MSRHEFGIRIKRAGNVSVLDRVRLDDDNDYVHLNNFMLLYL